MPLVEVVKQYPQELLIAMGARIGTDVAFYIFTLFILTLRDRTSACRASALNAVLIGSASSSRDPAVRGAVRPRRPPAGLRRRCRSAALWAFAFFPLLDTETWGMIVLRHDVGLVTHAAMYGPQAAFIAELFGTRGRYSGASLGYQLAGVSAARWRRSSPRRCWPPTTRRWPCRSTSARRWLSRWWRSRPRARRRAHLEANRGGARPMSPQAPPRSVPLACLL